MIFILLTLIAVTLVISGEPQGIVAKGITCVNTLFESVTTVIQKSPEFIKQLIEFGKTASEFPPKVKDMASNAGLNPMATIKAVKNTATNVKYLAGAPKDVKDFFESVKALVDSVKSLAGISSEPEEGNKESEVSKEDKKEDKQDKKESDSKTEAESSSQTTNTETPKATVAKPEVKKSAEAKVSVVVKKMNKRGGVELYVPNSIEELLSQGGQLLGITAVKVRKADTEIAVTDISFIKQNDVLYLTTEEDEKEF